MSQNWLRHFEVQLLDAKGEGITLSDFKAIFKVEWYLGKAPKMAEIKIYNLAADTANRIIGSEFSKIRLIAGYNGMMPVVSQQQVGIARDVTGIETGQRDGMNYGLIFSGDIRVTITGRENTPDSWLLIQAIDGHEAITYATISATLAKGYRVKDMYDLALAALKPYNIIAGMMPNFPDAVFPRGYTFHGKVSDYLNQIAMLCKADWKIIDDRLDMYPKDRVTHPAIKLNSASGLIGMPQRTTNAGVNATCLINPNIRLKGLIHLDQASILAAQTDLNSLKNLPASPSSSPQKQALSVATDGVYEVCGITYDGDTRGTNWKMELMCQMPGATDAGNDVSAEQVK